MMCIRCWLAPMEIDIPLSAIPIITKYSKTTKYKMNGRIGKDTLQ